MSTYRPLPSSLTIGNSAIHGLGVFAVEIIPPHTSLGMSRIKASYPGDDEEWVRTPLGGFINHSENPNCYISTDKGDRTLHTVIPVAKGEELTVYYRFKGYDGIVGDDTTPGNLQE